MAQASVAPSATCNCGASGCFINPGLNCLNKCVGKKCKKPTATKFFFNRRDYEDETGVFKNNNNLLKRIDTNQDFFLSKYTDCEGVTKEVIDKLVTGQKLGEGGICNIGKHKINYIKDLTTNSSPEETAEEEAATIKKIEITEDNWMQQMMEGEERERQAEERKLRISNGTLSVKAINYSYLGKDMTYIFHHLNFNEEKYVKYFLASIQNIFKGLLKLDKHGIYHGDIKPLNLVLDESDNKFKIIDFGSVYFERIDNPSASVAVPKPSASVVVPKPSTKPSTKPSASVAGPSVAGPGGDINIGFTSSFISPEFYYHKMKMHAGYGFYPPEYQLRELIVENNEYIFKLMLFEYNENKFEYKEVKSGKQTMTIKYIESLEEQKNGYKTYYKNDIWSMGYVLKAVQKVFADHFNALTESEKKAKFDYYNNIITGLGDVIKKMLILEVEKRPNALEALIIYQQFLENTLGIEMERNPRSLRVIHNKNEKRAATLRRTGTTDSATEGGRYTRKIKRRRKANIRTRRNKRNKRTRRKYK